MPCWEEVCEGLKCGQWLCPRGRSPPPPLFSAISKLLDRFLCFFSLPTMEYYSRFCSSAQGHEGQQDIHLFRFYGRKLQESQPDSWEIPQELQASGHHSSVGSCPAPGKHVILLYQCLALLEGKSLSFRFLQFVCFSMVGGCRLRPWIKWLAFWK